MLHGFGLMQLRKLRAAFLSYEFSPCCFVYKIRMIKNAENTVSAYAWPVLASKKTLIESVLL